MWTDGLSISGKNLRTYPGTLRGTPKWDSTYKIRTNVERSINHVKDSFGLAGRKTQNEKTLHADLILSGITQLVTVLLADKIHQHQYLQSVKPLIAQDLPPVKKTIFSHYQCAHF